MAYRQLLLILTSNGYQKRLRICKLDANVLEVEQTLMKKIPEPLWVKTHHTMIFRPLSLHCKGTKV